MTMDDTYCFGDQKVKSLYHGKKCFPDEFLNTMKLFKYHETVHTRYNVFLT